MAYYAYYNNKSNRSIGNYTINITCITEGKCWFSRVAIKRDERKVRYVKGKVTVSVLKYSTMSWVCRHKWRYSVFLCRFSYNELLIRDWKWLYRQVSMSNIADVLNFNIKCCRYSTRTDTTIILKTYSLTECIISFVTIIILFNDYEFSNLVQMYFKEV